MVPEMVQAPDALRVAGGRTDVLVRPVEPCASAHGIGVDTEAVPRQADAVDGQANVAEVPLHHEVKLMVE